MRYFILCAVPFALLAGCIKSTGPDAEGHRVDFALQSIVVRGICDEFPVDVDGGEWSHRLLLRFPGESGIDLGNTANYPNAASKRNVSAGGALAINTSQQLQSRELADVEGTAIELLLSATEWDYDVFGGNPRPDSRMNDRSAIHHITFTNGRWPTEPAGVLTLQNTSACRVDVNYSFAAVKLE